MTCIRWLVHHLFPLTGKNANVSQRKIRQSAVFFLARGLYDLLIPGTANLRRMALVLKQSEASSTYLSLCDFCLGLQASGTVRAIIDAVLTIPACSFEVPVDMPLETQDRKSSAVVQDETTVCVIKCIYYLLSIQSPFYCESYK